MRTAKSFFMLAVAVFILGGMVGCAEDAYEAYAATDEGNDALPSQENEEEYTYYMYELSYGLDDEHGGYDEYVENDEYGDGVESELYAAIDEYEPTAPVVRPSHIGNFEVSPEGWRAVEDFLALFPTLFMDAPLPVTGRGYGAGGWRYELEEGQFVLRAVRIGRGWPPEWELEITCEVPDIFFRGEDRGGYQTEETHGFFDRYGNRIDDVPWIDGDLYANGFTIWGFGYDGFPVVSVYFGGNRYDHTGNSNLHSYPGTLFIFSDGEYRPVQSGDGMHRHLSDGWFYFDDDSNLIWSASGAGGGVFAWFNYVEFTNGHALHTPLAVFELEFREWDNHLTGERGLPFDPSWQFNSWGSNSHFLYSAMGIRLTPVYGLGRL